MSFLVAFLFVTLVSPGLSCLWPISRGPCPTTTSTTPGRWAAEHAFEMGVMDSLGYRDGSSCFENAGDAIYEVYDIVKEYAKGGYYAKAKALAMLAEEVKKIISTLESCSAATTDVEQYASLMRNLKDPRYYSLHNACTLALNVAEDRAQLATFIDDLRKKQDYHAGYTLMHVILDVMEHPGIPSSNGTAALQIAKGFASGFVEDVDLKCFQDAKVEVPAVVGGVLECMSGVGIVPGLESLFHGLEGLVPLVKDCYQEKGRIMDLLAECADFKDPRGLARRLGHNILSNGVDITIELAQAALDIKGKEYQRLGEAVGKILSKVVISNATSVANQIATVVV